MRILILEDDPFVALGLQLIVEAQGHSVIGIYDSLAEARTHADSIDFAFLDIDVIDGKSFDLASTLGERHIPFAFVSASRRSELPAHLQHARFIAKPYGEASVIESLQLARAA